MTRIAHRSRTAGIAMIVTVLAGFGVVASGGGSPANGATSSPFTVVDVEPLSGQLATIGTAGVQGVKAAAAVLNASGGVLGHHVTVQYINDAGDPATAVSALQARLASGSKPDLVIPGALAAEAVATVPLLTRDGVLSIGPPNDPSLNNPSKYPLSFSTGTPVDAAPDALMAYLKKNHIKTLGLLISTDAFGASLESAIASAAHSAGVTLDTETYADTDLTLVPEVQALQAQNPPVVYLQAEGPAVGYATSARQQLGWTVPVIGDLSTAATLPPNLIGTAQLNGVKLLVPYPLSFVPVSQRSPGFKKFLKALAKQGPITDSLVNYSGRYDSLIVAAAGAEQAGSINAKAIAHALEHLRQPANPLWITNKIYNYTPTDHVVKADLAQWSLVSPTALTDGMIGS